MKVKQLDSIITNLPEWVKNAYSNVEADPEGVAGETAQKDGINPVKSQLKSIKSMAVNILKAHNSIKNDYAEILQTIEDIKTAKETIRNTQKLSDEVKQKLLVKMDQYQLDAEKLIPAALDEVNKNLAYVEDDVAEKSVIAAAVNALAELEKVPEGYETVVLDLKTVCVDELFTADGIRKEAAIVDGEEDDEENDEEKEEVDKYLVDNNQIVVVTYGDRDDKTFEKTAYKSFILNYNNFAVKVTYKDKSYTIPSGGYVVLYD